MESTEHIPEWTLADRLRKTREDMGLDQQEMADRLGIARQSVSNYERGHTRPLRSILKSWALATSVPEWWLRSGDVRSASGGPDSVTGGRANSGWHRRFGAKPRQRLAVALHASPEHHPRAFGLAA